MKPSAATIKMMFRLNRNKGLRVYCPHVGMARYVGSKRVGLGRRACVSVENVEAAYSAGLLERIGGCDSESFYKLSVYGRKVLREAGA